LLPSPPLTIPARAPGLPTGAPPLPSGVHPPRPPSAVFFGLFFFFFFHHFHYPLCRLGDCREARLEPAPVLHGSLLMRLA